MVSGRVEYHDEEEGIELVRHVRRSSVATRATIQKPEDESYGEFESVRLSEKNVFGNTKLKFQLLASFISLMIIGLLDQVLGSVIEYVMVDYGINRVQISYIILAQFCGYIPSSVFNSYWMSRLGVFKLYMAACGILCVCCMSYIVKIPFPLLVLNSVFIGWCNGTLDCCLNFFVGSLEHSNQLLGLMHAMYGVGCLISPVLSIRLINLGWAWNQFYYIILGCAFTNLVLVVVFYREETAEKYRRAVLNEDGTAAGAAGASGASGSGLPGTLEIVRNKHVLFYAGALFVYVGGELSVGVWMFNYLYRIRKVAETHASYITSSFWLFMTLGRALLGIFTGQWFEGREIRAIMVYCVLVAMGFSVFALGAVWDNLSLQIGAVWVAGFFVGPLFGTTIIISLKTLPERLSVGGISLIAGFGGMGAAIVPSLMGFVSESLGKDGEGLKYFPLLTVVMFGLAAAMWVGYYLQYREIYDGKKRLV